MKWLRRLYVAYAVALAFAAGAVLARPVAFQKSYAMTEGPVAPLEASNFDIGPFVGAIPYRDPVSFVDAVLPEARYRETILEGGGNCSNLAFGASYYLSSHGVDHQIVFLLPRIGFIDGIGHAVVRLHNQLDGVSRVGIVDLLAGAVPRSAGRALDVADLGAGAVTDFDLRSLNEGNTRGAIEYGDYLDGIRLGYVTMEEVQRYFRFVDAVHLPLGDGLIEKYIYDGLAVVAGRFPQVRVTSVSDLFRGAESTRFVMLTALWIVRGLFVLIPLTVLVDLGEVWSRRRAAPRHTGRVGS